MSETKMTAEEREAFLAGLHVGVLSIGRGDRAPLAAPIWYAYEPGGEIVVLTGPDSLKGRLLEVGTPVSLVAQQESMPYAYVSVEGRVRAIEPCDPEADTLPMAVRYLGEETGRAYTRATAGSSSVKVSISCEKWLTVDYAKSSPL